MKIVLDTVFPQVIYEFWVVCTRPKSEYDGFGMTTSRAKDELQRLKELVELLADPPDLYQIWERLVVQHDVKGKSAHDARLVAAMFGAGLKHLLTFDATDFDRFLDMTILIPETLASPPPEVPGGL